MPRASSLATPVMRASSILLHRHGEKPLSQALQLVCDMVSFPTLVTWGGATLPPATDGTGAERGGWHLSFFHTTALQTRKQGCLSFTLSGLPYLQAPHGGPVLLCCPDKVQDPLSQVLKRVRGRDSSPASMTTGPALPPAIDGKEGGGRSVPLRHPHHYMGDE